VKSERNFKSEQGYFVLDRRGRFLSASTAIQSTTKYSEEELLELTITDLMSTEQQRKFFRWASMISKKETDKPLRVAILDKVGESHAMELHLKSFRDDDDELIGYRGTAVTIKDKPDFPTPHKGQFNQAAMVTELINAIQTSYHEPLNVLLERIAEIICQVFGFYRSTVALLDRRKHAFIKQAMVGYMTGETNSIEQRAIEVPQEVIDRIFTDRFKIKVIYYTQDKRESGEYISPGVPERRTQKRRPEDQWHKRDLILLNLTDRSGNTFGYISLDDPVEGSAPTRSTFYNLELFASLTSMAIENYYRFSALERRSRRLKQVLVTSNIFKLHLSLSELLKEVVWSVKFSLDFNIVSLILISKKTGMLETKAVACDDKIKMLQLRELKYDLKEFGELLKDGYRRGKSYLISDEEPVLSTLKRIYYGAQWDGHYSDGWPYWGALLVPLKSREGKIIGFLVVDDPADRRIPGADTIHTLEILANQIAVAIDNRVMYVQAKEQLHEIAEKPDEPEEGLYQEDYAGGGLKKLVEKFLR
jgi:PAS domain S-box-containing protein